MEQHLLESAPAFLVLENKEMNINLFINCSSKGSTIIDFCKQSKKINFMPQELNKFSLLHLLFSTILRGNTISDDKITSQNLHRSD